MDWTGPTWWCEEKRLPLRKLRLPLRKLRPEQARVTVPQCEASLTEPLHTRKKSHNHRKTIEMSIRELIRFESTVDSVAAAALSIRRQRQRQCGGRGRTWRRAKAID